MSTVKTLPFRPRIEDFWKQTTGCMSLFAVFPATILIPTMVALPWRTTAKLDEWLSGAMLGGSFGLGGFLVFVFITALLRRRSLNIKEAKSASETAKQILQEATKRAEGARENAKHGSQWVDQAYQCFSAPEYNPFWEAVENSRVYLRRCCEALADVHRARINFAELLDHREHTFPDIDEEIGTLFDPRPDMTKLADIIRKANGDTTFSTIFAQRETTRAVKEGFEGLTSAIHQMEQSVTASIEKLRTSVVAEVRKAASIQTKILQGVELIATRSAENA